MHAQMVTDNGWHSPLDCLAETFPCMSMSMRHLKQFLHQFGTVFWKVAYIEFLGVLIKVTGKYFRYYAVRTGESNVVTLLISKLVLPTLNLSEMLRQNTQKFLRPSLS